MIEFLIAAIVCGVLNLFLLYRIFRGPTAADRMCAADALDLVSALALVLYSLYTGRAIYLDIALVVALLGFVGTVFVARYLEGRL
ncbi:MAG: monovalent cation/H+ antiporter complex subunit F [Candidatus Onthomonas sp.]|nr:monovalent cation/H+ antiporter complex subunit F [Candidatus Onthomonas sp.]